MGAETHRAKGSSGVVVLGDRVAALEEGPRYMPPEPMPRGGPAGAGRDGARGGRGEGPRPVCHLEDPPRPVPYSFVRHLIYTTRGAAVNSGLEFYWRTDRCCGRIPLVKAGVLGSSGGPGGASGTSRAEPKTCPPEAGFHPLPGRYLKEV